MEIVPEVAYVQFVDGDCEVMPGWLEAAAAELAREPQLAIVYGRRRERHPRRSVYNRLCDLEWDTPVGPAKACGGDAMIRAAALAQVGGYDPTMIAGEEPELCVRLRQRGWRIVQLAAEMSVHDAAMTRFSQWWQRAYRAGHAYAEGAFRHGAPPERHWVRESRSIWLWGFGFPVGAVALAWHTHGWSLVALGGYGLLATRIALDCRRRGRGFGDTFLYTGFTLLGKFPQLFGQISYHARRVTGRTPQLIEYKGPAG